MNVKRQSNLAKRGICHWFVFARRQHKKTDGLAAIRIIA